MLADYHVHTEYSDDPVYPMENVIQDAIRIGLDEICFTDHVDYGVKCDWDSGKPIEYRNVHRYHFDFIILSVHQIEDREFWTQDFQTGKTQQEYQERYYGEMQELVKRFKDYSVIGHMDLIARYDKAGIYPFEKIEPLVADILKTVISDGKGIELNTSYHRYGLSDTTPSKEILRLYQKLGGRIITIGSDSHKPEQLGSYIQEGKQKLRSMGYHSFCTYDKMKPIFHDL